MIRMANQAKLRSFRTAPKYQYGFEVPRDYNHAVQIDKSNGNTKWQDAVDLEMKQLDEYDTFKDIGKNALSLPITRKFEFILCLRLNMTVVIKLVSLPMAILPTYRSIAYILELYRSEASD